MQELPKCPYCNGTLVKSGHTKAGTQRYACKECGRKSAGDSTRSIAFKAYKKVKCVHCGSVDIKRKGKAHRNCNCGYIFYCNECKRKFTLYKDLTEFQRTTIIKYHFQFKMNITNIAQGLGISRVLVKRYIKQSQEKCGAQEHYKTDS